MTERQIGGRYVLERRIAGGGMGDIWVARDTQLQRQVALKLMEPRSHSSSAARHRFEQEAMASARLHNPHVIQIHDSGIDGDTPYIVLERLEGEDLEERLHRRGRLAPAVVANLLNQVAKALADAHEAGIIHRDLKPANLFLARVAGEEVLKVLDFGLARLDAGEDGTAPAGHGEGLMGTRRYMSPEQMRGDAHIDHRSDLWSLGVVVYRALTGRFPFSTDVLGMLRSGDPQTPISPPTSVASELGAEADAFFARALAPEPAQRFQSARELAAAFAALVEASRSVQPAKILVVDDERDVEDLMRQRFRKQIREALYEFIFAGNGEEALEKLRLHPDIEVVLSDINMPRMDGLTFLSRVGEVNPLVKVIILSAYSDMSNIRVAMNRGAFDFLVKPIDFQDLESTLVKTLRHAKELRRMVRTVEENQLLRMFVREGVVERMLPLVHGADMVAAERVEATVAFIDVEDFTPLTLREQPEVALRRLNDNFEVIVPELLSQGGVVDKFVGDAVMAVFRGLRHAERALEACCKARQQLQEWAFRNGARSSYSHGVCIGLDSGELLFGNIGSRGLRQLGCTVLGDVVNTAARLASLAGKDQLLISERLRQRVEGSFECLALEPRCLPGTSTPVLLYEVLCRREEAISTEDTTTSIDGQGTSQAETQAALMVALPAKDTKLE